MTDNAKLLSDRLAHWTQQGLKGAAVYDALASDPSLPAFFVPADLAALQGVVETTVRQQRHRGAGPAYLKPSRKTVLYPRAELASWLRDRFVKVG